MTYDGYLLLLSYDGYLLLISYERVREMDTFLSRAMSMTRRMERVWEMDTYLS